MANYNRVILAGNMTRAIEIRHSQGGMAIGKFGLAINRKVKDQESTCYVDITAFGQTAELIERYTDKGSPILVEGRLEFSTWEAKDGGKRSKLEVIVDNFQFLNSRDDGAKSPAKRGGGKKQDDAEVDADYGDIPF